MTRVRMPGLILLVAMLALSPAGGLDRGVSTGPIKAQDMKEWLTFLASDELEGRSTFSEGLGIAAQYIAGQLRAWGVKPGGDNGSYFQHVAVRGIRTEDRSTVTVETGGQTKTFKAGEGIAWARTVGGKQSFTSDRIEFVGYGLALPSAGVDDYKGVDVRGKVAVWLGTRAPESVGQSGFRLMGGRGRTATEEHGAIAGIGQGFGGGGRGGGGGAARPAATGAAALETPDFTTAERYDAPRPPLVNGQDDFFEFLFSGQDTKYAELKSKAGNREPLAPFTLKDVKITFNLDADYRVVRTQFTRNVVGIVEGRDAKLRDTYVAFGAHYDHVGYAEGEVTTGETGSRRPDSKGRVTAGTVEHRYWNGADDDGSGTVTLLSLAKAFARGPKPKRSLLFVWHAGEERGLWGSHYFVDYPTVPIDKIVTQLNMDMIGRNRDNKAEENDTVYLVGSDRISSELHNLTLDANRKIAAPLKLNFELNDPADPEQIYYRSDHYCYAAKGIPIVFFTTGLHPDYHANTDTPDRILYDKMARIGSLVYQTGMLTANLDHPPEKDRKGPRVGKGADGKLN